uniref:Nucleoporin_N domain-containing protein n=1 Tax=Anisakis simplex TaxID=6269 RepID=A0A0M3KE99_ANISI
LAFDATQPFPSRYTIEQKQRAYLAVLEERLSRRKQLRQCLSTTAKPNLNDGYVIELVTFCGTKQGCGYICAGNQTKGIVSRFTITATTSTLQKLDHEASRFECRILSMIAPDEDIAFLSLLSAYIVAVHIKGLNVEILWELKLNDVPLKLLHYDEHLYAALASGTLTVIENVTELVPNELELYHLPIGAAPISDVVVVNHTLCLAVACKIVVLSIPRPSFTCLDGRQDMEITMVLYVHEQIWIGTNDGYLIIYDVKNSAANDTSKLLRPPPVQKYPAGLRLSPKSGSVCAIHHLPTYYIPTESETRHDERVSVAEYPAAERQGRKVSMFMNQNTKRYSIT